MRRNIALVLLIVGVALTTWLRSERWLVVPNDTLHFTALKLPPRAVLKAHLGAFELEGAWHMTLGNYKFGGYSALLALPDGRLLAISDFGRFLAFTPPGGRQRPARHGNLISDPRNDKRKVDSESATRDPRNGQIWLGLEFLNGFVRLGPNWAENGRAQPASMASWGENSGPEAMIRLADGRFVAMSEGAREWLWPRHHDGVVFPGDPVVLPDAGKHFTFDGPSAFDPVDMAQMPDGRVLVLMRTLIWPLPERFAGRIAIGDPSRIRAGATWHVTEVARLASTLPVDNFEGMAVVPRADGKVIVWLISDDNQTRIQRTLLWKLVVDPAKLPR
ncbi:esterase-like activity of phytase family protein [Novosphingobium sp. 9U]|uniref:esterase-like activity of phytase family protein n=1 Tax=Novosphingobium sp. 9U TaxID=2653158 RepID=UPI0012F28A61|nr:esterase-like activity of phytase family protein [Novosphingobium sp. 9U]VWX53664.1 conserved hypothetical protein [Novosphingobium sp. 9U]